MKNDELEVGDECYVIAKTSYNSDEVNIISLNEDLAVLKIKINSIDEASRFPTIEIVEIDGRASNEILEYSTKIGYLTEMSFETKDDLLKAIKRKID